MIKNIFLIIILHSFLYTSAQEDIFISEIIINGNKITKNDIITRELTFKKDSTYKLKNLEKHILKSKENLTNLLLFNFIEIEKNINKNNAEIIVNLTERWYIKPFPILELSERNFNSWWEEFKRSNYSDFSRVNYGLFLVWDNFRGKNDRFKFKLRRGFKEHYVLSYEIPFLNKNKTIGMNNSIQLFRRKKSFYQTINDTLMYYTNKDIYTTKDYQTFSELIYRGGINNTHKIRFQYFRSYLADEIRVLNPDYIRTNLDYGSYKKLTYQFSKEHRDHIEYPLNGYFIHIEGSKYFEGTSPVKNFELIGKAEKHTPIYNSLFIGSSIKFKISSEEYQPYFAQKALGFDDYVRGYEYYVIDGQNFWLSKTAIKYAIVEKTSFEIPYIKMNQFRKSHYSLYLGLFSDLSYVSDNQNYEENTLSNQLLFGNGICIDYVTYYDKLIRIEFSINHLGEKGVFLHFSNPFGSKKEL